MRDSFRAGGERAHHTRPANLSCKYSLIVALAFIARLWSVHPRGFVFLAARSLDGRWIERGFHVIFGWRAMRRFIRDHSPLTHDLYYCPNAFGRRKRLAEFALPTPLSWCDIDGADPDKFRPQPTTLIETSPGRYQGLWRFGAKADPESAEATSRDLTNTYRGDPGCWSITKMLRLPGTLNHKPTYNLPTVKIVRDSDRIISHWPKFAFAQRRELRTIKIDPTRFDPDAVIEKYRAALAPSRVRLMKDASVKSRDRSRMIFIIVVALHDAGATPDEIGAVVLRSPYFLSKHSADCTALNAELNRILAKL